MANTIKQKLDVAAASANAGLRAAANGVKNGANKVAHGVVRVAEVLGDAKQQRQLEAKIDRGINRAKTAIGTAVDSANTTMKTKGEAALAAPIKGLSQMNIAHVPVTGSSSQKAKARVRNGLATYHNFVSRAGEDYARRQGVAAHALTNFVLGKTVRILLEVVGLGSVGKLVQRSVALAVGFVVRGTTLAATQLAHAVPYALGVAALGGIAAATVFGGAKLIAAVGITAVIIGTILVADRALFGGLLFASRKKGNRLESEVEELKGRLTALSQSTLVQQAKTGAKKLAGVVTAPVKLAYEHKRKIAALTALAVTALGLGAIFFGVPKQVTETLEPVLTAVQPYAEQVANAAAPYAEKASEYAQTASKAAGEYAQAAKANARIASDFAAGKALEACRFARICEAAPAA